MTRNVLTPHLPFHDDEVSQGYFARNGYYHAGVSAGKFCRYSHIHRADFRSGSDAFCDAAALLTGVPQEKLQLNSLRLEADGSHCMRGESLAVEVLRRTFVKFCPQCLHDDLETHSGMVDGALRLRWTWLLQPVVVCPIHSVLLKEIPASDPVNAFDLGRLFAQNGIRYEDALISPEAKPGALQNYVVNRMSKQAVGPKWLDEQGIWPCVKLCQMLGALVDRGPEPMIRGYTDEDWANAGDIGFDVCSEGPEAIFDCLAQMRVSAGRSSGRAGPQATYGFLFNWLKYSTRGDDFNRFRDIVREAIIQNFAIGAGETVLGREIVTRRVHSVNSLAAKAGVSRFRLYRLMRKMGAIPVTDDQAAFNQQVFPADEGERLIARIQNSVPLNKVRHVLGCTKTHAEQLAKHGLISSVVPIANDEVGVTQGYFNLEDLGEFASTVFGSTCSTETEDDGFVDLTVAAKGRSSTAEILHWLLNGKLPGTRLIGGVKRLDRLRFDLDQIKELTKYKSHSELHRLTKVALMLGINLSAVKKLISKKNGGPWLSPASAEVTKTLRGGAYVSSVEIVKFQAEYLPVALIARQLGSHASAIRSILSAHGISPQFDPAWLGARIYRRDDVSELISKHQQLRPAKTHQSNSAEPIAAAKADISKSPENAEFCESDDVIL